MKKVELSDSETAAHLQHSLESLRRLNSIYDADHPHIAPQLATILVNLTINEGKSVSMLRQLNLENVIYLYTSQDARINSNNLLPENKLILVRMSDKLDFLPRLNEGGFPFDKRVGIREWLREQVVKQDQKWSRQQILLAVRNMEGSHVDRFVSAAFRQLKYANPFGVAFMKGNPLEGGALHDPPPYSAIYAAVRHMAFEVEKSLAEQIRFN